MKILQIKNFLINKNIRDENIFIGKTKKSILIGPKISKNFDGESFYKRMISSSLFELKNYKKLSISKAKKFLDIYFLELRDNEIVEIFKDEQIQKYTIIKVPVGYNEKQINN